MITVVNVRFGEPLVVTLNTDCKVVTKNEPSRRRDEFVNT
jgi:hypothetical protein